MTLEEKLKGIADYIKGPMFKQLDDGRLVMWVQDLARHFYELGRKDERESIKNDLFEQAHYRELKYDEHTAEVYKDYANNLDN